MTVGILAMLITLASTPELGGASLGILPEKAVFTGCGCSFTTMPSVNDLSAIVFSSEYEGTGRILIGGVIIELAAIRPDAACWPSRVGGGCRLKYRNGETTVVIDARATWVCPADDESCEVVRLVGKLTTHIGNQQEVIEVHGECGC